MQTEKTKSKRVLRIAATSVLAFLLLGLGHWVFNSKTSHVERGIASKPNSLGVNPNKLKEWPSPHDHGADTFVSGKRYSSIGLEIFADTKEAAEKGRPFSLRGVVSPKEDMSDVKVKWVLPPQVQVVSGALENHIGFLGKEDSREFEITLLSSSDENQQIHFTAFQLVAGEEVGNVVQYNTILQPVVVHKDKVQKAGLNESSNHVEAEKNYVQ